MHVRFFNCYNRKIVKKAFTITIGVDEVGRGPLAGPVTVGAFYFKKPIPKKELAGLRDSKKLSEAQRDAWFKKITAWKKEGTAMYAVSFVSAQTIDRKGIMFAIQHALNSSLKKLSVHPKKVTVLLDGGLHAPKEYVHQTTIIKGDEKEITIALASIASKVLRDRRLKKLATVFPKYGFEVHKGYGTKKHIQAIKKYGLSIEHRKTFLKKYTK
jgi:ribonuclease HII